MENGIYHPDSKTDPSIHSLNESLREIGTKTTPQREHWVLDGDVKETDNALTTTLGTLADSLK